GVFTLIAPSSNPFDSSIVGLPNFQIGGPRFPNISPWLDGHYAVTGYVDSAHITLNSCPVSGSSASNGWGDTGQYTNGWKVNINFCNAANCGCQGNSSGPLEITMVDGDQIRYPQMYGQQGHDGYPLNHTVPWSANQWFEITERIIVGGQNTPDSD